MRPPSYSRRMRKLTVESSNVQSITHFPEVSALEVEFASGSTYRYHNCSLDDFASACHAPSVGSWVQSALVHQRDKHPFERVAHTKPSPPVDQRLVTLQAIASVQYPKGMDMALVDAARAALEGCTPPSLPPKCSKPAVIAGRVVWMLDDVDVEHFNGSRLSMTPDEAEGVGHALLASALQARL